MHRIIFLSLGVLVLFICYFKVYVIYFVDSHTMKKNDIYIYIYLVQKRAKGPKEGNKKTKELIAYFWACTLQKYHQT